MLQIREQQMIQMTADFSSETMKRRQQNIFTVLKENNYSNNTAPQNSRG